jgi:hypothetical protein
MMMMMMMTGVKSTSSSTTPTSTFSSSSGEEESIVGHGSVGVCGGSVDYPWMDWGSFVRSLATAMLRYCCENSIHLQYVLLMDVKSFNDLTPILVNRSTI